MELQRISGQDVWLIARAHVDDAEIGQVYAVMEHPVKGQTSLTDGIIVQIVELESLSFDGMMQETIQKILEDHLEAKSDYDHELGMDTIKSLKLVRARIRKRARSGKWESWDGWITSRNVSVMPVSAHDLLCHIMPEPKHVLNCWAWHDGVPVVFSGERFDLTNVLVGEKGSGKSHQTKQIILALAAAGVPLIVTDPTSEYVALPNIQRLAWQENFTLDLSEVGWEVLISMVDSLHPLPVGSASEGAFRNGLALNFKERRKDCERRGVPFTIDLPYLITNSRWPSEGAGKDYVVGAIRDRLNGLAELDLFAVTTEPHGNFGHEKINSLMLAQVYEAACAGHPAVIDMGALAQGLQGPLVRAVNMAIMGLARAEQASGRWRLPYLIFDEAQEYISERSLLGLIKQARHLGISTTFVTNSPTDLPASIFRQCDNLILMSLNDRDDIRAVSRSAFADADTIASFASRLKPHQALIMGRLTDYFPLVVSIDDLPTDVPRSGVTKSTWTRFISE